MFGVSANNSQSRIVGIYSMFSENITRCICGLMTELNEKKFLKNEHKFFSKAKFFQ